MSDINEPTTTVTDVQQTMTFGAGMAGIVVCIGSFGIVGDGTIKSYNNPRLALSELKGELNEVPSEAYGYHALEYLFGRYGDSLGLSELMIVNTTTSAEGTVDYTLTNEKLADALELISDEHFNILFVADELDESKLTNIKTLRNSMYKNQYPWGLISAVTVETKEEVEAVSEIFKEGGAYKLITTPKQLEGDVTPLTLINTAAWDTAYTAGKMVNKSETGKTIPGVIGGNTKEEYPTIFGDILEKGLHSQKIYNRRLKEVRVNNIRTPTGKDMSIERTKDFIVGDLALRDIYGDPNSKPTREGIGGMFFHKSEEYKRLGLIDDMKYDITACNDKCVKAELELFIPDIITEVRLFVKVTPSAVEVE